jgi:hypothetical protein
MKLRGPVRPGLQIGIILKPQNSEISNSVALESFKKLKELLRIKKEWTKISTRTPRKNINIYFKCFPVFLIRGIEKVIENLFSGHSSPPF